MNEDIQIRINFKKPNTKELVKKVLEELAIEPRLPTTDAGVNALKSVVRFHFLRMIHKQMKVEINFNKRKNNKKYVTKKEKKKTKGTAKKRHAR